MDEPETCEIQGVAYSMRYRESNGPCDNIFAPLNMAGTDPDTCRMIAGNSVSTEEDIERDARSIE